MYHFGRVMRAPRGEEEEFAGSNPTYYEGDRLKVPPPPITLQRHTHT
jgi:hypothetical protein